MKIRLLGLPDETARAAELLAQIVDVVEDSGDRDRRGDGRLVQRYLEVRLP